MFVCILTMLFIFIDTLHVLIYSAFKKREQEASLKQNLINPLRKNGLENER